MASVGGAAAQGLESGLGLGLRMRAQEQQEEGIRRQNLLQDEQLQRQREADKRLEDDRALEAIGKEFDDLRTEGEGYIQQFGGVKNIPAEISGPYSERTTKVSGTRNTLLRKRYEPLIAQHEQRAKDLFMNLQSGRVDMKDVAPADLFHAVMVQTRRDPADLIGRDGKPSKVSTAVTDIMDGLQFGNEGAVLRGANILLEPELKVGLGEPSPHGGTIVGKQIVKLIPHPGDPNKVLPVVKVFVRRGGQGGGDVARAEHIAEEGAPPGATGYYIAPVTENRSSDPNDPPKAIDLNAALEYAAKMQTLSTALSNPEIASKFEQGRKVAGAQGDEFSKAFFSVRGKMPTKAPIEYKAVPRGGRLAGFDTATGRPTGDVVEGAPIETKATGLAAQIDAVRQFAEEEGIDDLQEAASRMQGMGLLRAPKAGKGGAGGAGLRRSSGVGGDLTGEDFLKTLNPEDAKIVKGLAEGTIKPESISTKGDRREHMLALAAQYAPDAGGSGKPLPEPVRKAITEVRDNAATVNRMLGTFKDEFGGKGVFGLGADKQMSASAMIGADKDAVAWWKNYRKGAELVERHAMFGASLTTGEQDAWRSADISPGMDPAVIRENLETRSKLAAKVLEATKRDLIDAGHAEKRITAIADRDMSIDQAPAGKPAAAAPAGAPFRLPADDAAARAAYAKLKPGTQYVAPDGTTRTKK